MLKFSRGGKALPLSGLLITIVGLVHTIGRLKMANSDATGIAISAFCLISGPLMVLLFARVDIDPQAKTVTLVSGLRFSPKTVVHAWDEFDAVIAFEPSSINSSDSSYVLSLRDEKSQERTVLVQQYQSLEDMHTVAKQLSQLMDIPAIKSHRGEESSLV